MDAISRRDPKNLNNKMSLEQVKALTPSFDFDRYLKLVNAPKSPHYIVSSVNFFKGMEGMFQHHPLEHWKTYLRWQLLLNSTPGLGNAFLRESFDFFEFSFPSCVWERRVSKLRFAGRSRSLLPKSDLKRTFCTKPN